MEAPRSPFVEKEVYCPACRAIHIQRYFKMRTFIPKSKDSDQHITEYKWLDDNMIRVHPPNYFLFYCPTCFFTDTSEDFSKPTEVDNLRWILDTIRRAGGRDNPVIAFLGERVRYDEIDFPSALNLHFLASYMQLIVSKDMLNHYKAARILLRLAWLFREQNIKEQKILAPTDDGEKKPDPANEARLEAEQVISRVEELMEDAKEAWRSCKSPILNYLDVNNAPTELRTTFAERQEVIDNLFNSYFTELYMLKMEFEQQVSQHQSRRKSYKPGKDLGYFDFPNLTAFLTHLKSLWPEAPTDEISAMRRSITHFERAISIDPRFDSADAYFTIASLIIDLLVRCNDLDPAFNMIRGMYKAGGDARQHYMEQLQQKNLDDMAKQRIQNAMRRVATNLQNAADLRKQLMDHLMARDLPTVERILAENPKANLETIEKILQDEGISPGLIAHLKQDGNLLSTVGAKKKGFF